MDLGRNGSQDRVDRGRDGAIEPTVDQELRQRSENEDLALSPDLLQSGLEGGQLVAVNDLGGLHADA